MHRPRAAVLAAGAGRRIWPFGTTTSKALLPVGAEVLLARTMRQLHALGCAEAVVACGGPHDRAVRAFCAATARGRATPTLVPAGTADACLAALEGTDAPLLCVYGDTWFPAGALDELLAGWDGQEARVLLAPLGAERSQDWICADLAAGGEVRRLQGHPRGGSHRAAGAFLLPAGFRRLLEANPGQGVRTQVGGMPHAEADLEESLNLFLEAGGRVCGIVAAASPVDLDKPWHILAANAAAVDELLRGADGLRAAPGATVSPEADIRAPVVLEAGAEIGRGVIVRAPLYMAAGARLTDGAIIAGTSLLGPGARVSDFARLDRAVIGARAVVGHCAEITGVVMEGAYIVHYSEIYGVVGRGVDIGAATVCGTLRFDDGTSRQRVGGPEGRWETPAACGDACYLGDHCRTGVNVTLQPGRSIGAHSCVGPSVLVGEDVPEGTLLQVRQELTSRPWGPQRYGW